MIKNYTPHTINFLPPEGEPFEVASEGVARVGMETRTLDIHPRLHVPAVTQVPGEVTGLPSPVEGVILVASAMVANAAKRSDVCHPAEFVRDEGGRILGARALSFPYVD